MLLSPSVSLRVSSAASKSCACTRTVGCIRLSPRHGREDADLARTGNALVMFNMFLIDRNADHIRKFEGGFVVFTKG
ncbi:hypothetical protein D3C80_1854590 [compost metagenome]